MIIPHRIPPFDPGFIAEAEFKHARVAMVAVPSLALISALTTHDPVTFLSDQPIDVQLACFAGFGTLEAASLSRLGPLFTLRPDVTPGVFPPLSPSSQKLIDAELQTGRVAMLAVAGFMFEDLLAHAFF